MIRKMMLVLVAALALLTACKDDPLTQHAEGYVRDFGTHTPVAGIPVILASDYVMDTCITDENGFYSFDFEPFNDLLSFAPISDKHYPFTTSKRFGGNLSGPIEYNITLHPKAWIKFHVKNVNPVNEWDNIDYWNNTDPLYGMSVDTTVIHEYPGNKVLPLYWTVVKSGTGTLYSDSIYLPAYDTTFYEILY